MKYVPTVAKGDLYAVLEAVNDLIANKNIPALWQVKMLAPLQYVFTLNNVWLRTRIAEASYRNDRDHTKTFELFTNTLPLAHQPITTVQEVN